MAEPKKKRSALESEVREALHRILVREKAQEAARARREKPLELPPVGWTLEDALEEAPDEILYTVEGLHPEGGNTVFSARYKTGKTTALGNLTRSLADGEPFLGEFDVKCANGIAYFNYELPENQFLRWLDDLDIDNEHRVIPLQLRGLRLPFWVPAHRKKLVEWLRANKIDVIIMDPLAKAWKGLVDNENDNVQVGRFLDAVDTLKTEAGVTDVFIAHHLGRKEHAEDAEHGRGATVIDDWPDALWYLTKERDESRSFRAEGRDVFQPAHALSYDSETRRLGWTNQTRRARREESGLRKALEALATLKDAKDYPANTTTWRKAIGGLDNEARGEAIKRAKTEKYVKVKEGEKNAQLHSLTAKGRAFLEGEEGQ